MENRKFLVDSSVIIKHLRATNKEKTDFYQLSENEIWVSSITVFEVYFGANNESKIKELDLIFETFKILSFSKEIALLAVELQQKLKVQNAIIGLPDLLIAATAKYHNLPIKTLNKKHFTRIEGLQVL